MAKLQQTYCIPSLYMTIIILYKFILLSSAFHPSLTKNVFTPLKLNSHVEEKKLAKPNPKVFLDIRLGESDIGRMEFELFKNIVPKTAENFRALCTGEKGIGKSGKPLYYKNSCFHRIIPSFMCQGGDITHGNGFGGESIYGYQFDDENFLLKHDTPGLLSMANAGPNSGSSQFFVTTVPCNWLDGRHTVFGKLIKGEPVLRAIEAVGADSGVPKVQVIISNSGQL